MSSLENIFANSWFPVQVYSVKLVIVLDICSGENLVAIEIALNVDSLMVNTGTIWSSEGSEMRCYNGGREKEDSAGFRPTSSSGC